MKGETCNLICLRHLLRLPAVVDLKSFSKKDLFFFTCFELVSVVSTMHPSISDISIVLVLADDVRKAQKSDFF